MACQRRLCGVGKVIHIALRSEYSFKKTYGYIKDIAEMPGDTVGVADINSTFGHVPFEKACKVAGKKPLFGVRLTVGSKEDDASRIYGSTYIFIAKNAAGLREIYELTKKSYEKFYYIPRIAEIDVINTSNNVIVISSNPIAATVDRLDYVGLSVETPLMALSIDKPKVAINENCYTYAVDKEVYQLMCGVRRVGRGYSYAYQSNTYPQHILAEDEWLRLFHDKEAIANTYKIADMCNVVLPKADRTKYKGKDTIEALCIDGAKRKGIDLTDPIYKARYERELELIYEKEYAQYFLIIADMIKYAKRTMLVGPSRGSSAGSLVCYLMDITEVDPIRFDLLFERFIDLNRHDLPDIDIDFPDVKRDGVIRYLERTYGKDKVGHIGNVNTFRPKSAIVEFSKSLDIPVFETQDIKNAIITRSGGDARAKMCMLDTFKGTDAGTDFIAKYPKMELAGCVEAHAINDSIHAAGILVCNDELTKYAGVNTRSKRVVDEDTGKEKFAVQVMMNKKDAEYLDLLKIDALGLRTLSILEDACEAAGMNPQELYTIPLDDKKTFQLFNDMRLNGIFQFEGQALAFITRNIGVHEFNDIVAITALARPGAMNSGGTNRYIKYKIGQETPVYLGDMHREITEETMGIVIYQEQMMSMARNIGSMSWEDVSDLRRAASKSLGDEFFAKYKEKFTKGATEVNGYTEEHAQALWHDISATGSWTFNKSHAVSYGLVSYWTAYMKANYPLEFAIANLNHIRNEQSALRFLRDLVENEGMEYSPVDPDHSLAKWSVHDGKLLGGLVNVKGIGLKKAEQLVNIRETKGRYPLGMAKTLLAPKTPFDILYPTRHYFGDFYDDPDKIGLSEPPDFIADVNDEGEYMIIGRVIERDLRDRNDYQSVIKRGGRYVDDNQYYLKLKVEDDTDSILCIIAPQDFDKLNGKHLSETSVEGVTWYLIKGQLKSDWRMLTVTAIYNLQEFVAEKDADDAKDSYYAL